ncbi:MAG TPA: ABC transporter substrate-binding protein [Rhizomicrobium sp.]|jgi:iron complex transport system substrate-binding protein
MRVKHSCHVFVLILALAWGGGVFAAPQRVVSINLCTDEYVFRLVPRDHIAALSILSGDRNPVVSTIADQVGGIRRIRQTTEEVLGLNPDLVVLDAGSNARIREHLLRAHVPVLEVPYVNSLSEIRDTTRMLGEKLDAQGKAQALLAEMDRDIEATREHAPHLPVRALIYEPNGYATSGGVTEEMMAMAGLADAAPALRPTRLGTIPVETIVTAAPELLILAGRPDAQGSRADLLLHHPALSALKNIHVAWASTNALLCPGPWSVKEALTFAELGRETRALAKGAAAK